MFMMMMKNVRQFTCTNDKHQVRFRRHFRIVGPHCGTCFMTPFWRLEFGGAFYLLWKIFGAVVQKDKKDDVGESKK